MIDSAQLAPALSGQATVTTTCPPPFVAAGTRHSFRTSATLNFDNPESTAVGVEITLVLKAPGRELDRRQEQFDIPPGGPTLHTVNWPHEYTLHIADRTLTLMLTVKRRDPAGTLVLSSWHVCQFTVE